MEDTGDAGAELSILLAGDKKMLQLNSSYRGKKKSTDVLSFEAGIPVKAKDAVKVLGDVAVNVPVAESRARRNGTGVYEEIYRLLIHGILHLYGYEHEASAYRARKMRKKEEEIFSALKEMDTKRK